MNCIVWERRERKVSKVCMIFQGECESAQKRSANNHIVVSRLAVAASSFLNSQSLQCAHMERRLIYIRSKIALHRSTHVAGDAIVVASFDDCLVRKEFGDEFKLLTAIEHSTTSKHSSKGPRIAPSMPNRYIPPTIESAVRYGWPPPLISEWMIGLKFDGTTKWMRNSSSPR